jgi:hypothetical protein
VISGSPCISILMVPHLQLPVYVAAMLRDVAAKLAGVLTEDQKSLENYNMFTKRRRREKLKAWIVYKVRRSTRISYLLWERG